MCVHVYTMLIPNTTYSSVRLRCVILPYIHTVVVCILLMDTHTCVIQYTHIIVFLSDNIALNQFSRVALNHFFVFLYLFIH